MSAQTKLESGCVEPGLGQRIIGGRAIMLGKVLYIYDLEEFFQNLIYVKNVI
jgi:hypothetical protein